MKIPLMSQPETITLLKEEEGCEWLYACLIWASRKMDEHRCRNAQYRRDSGRTLPATFMEGPKHHLNMDGKRCLLCLHREK